MNTEYRDPRYDSLDAWPTADAMQALYEGQLAAVAAVSAALPAIAAAADAMAGRLSGGGRIIYVGAGTSGRIAVQDGVELPPTFDWPEARIVPLLAGGNGAMMRSAERAEDDADAGIAAIAAVDAGTADVAIGVAASGGTPFTCAAIEEARRRGALTIGIANNAGARLVAAAAHGILVETGAEAVAGSTRMKAGTAQKVVLNLLSTGTMLRLHRIYRGQMVDMRASNAKLEHRAVRMLAALSDGDEIAAAAALSETDGRVKPAVLMRAGATLPQAKALLDAHSGDLRAALAALAPREIDSSHFRSS